jgi:hypothetical protein
MLVLLGGAQYNIQRSVAFPVMSCSSEEPTQQEASLEASIAAEFTSTEVAVKVVRFFLWDLWIKLFLWVFLWFIMIPYKIIQVGVRKGTAEGQQAATRRSRRSR